MVKNRALEHDTARRHPFFSLYFLCVLYFGFFLKGVAYLRYKSRNKGCLYFPLFYFPLSLLALKSDRGFHFAIFLCSKLARINLPILSTQTHDLTIMWLFHPDFNFPGFKKSPYQCQYHRTQNPMNLKPPLLLNTSFSPHIRHYLDNSPY